jgi:hypothetical protein
MKDTTRSPADLATSVSHARDLLERFMDHGDRHLFQLVDGRGFEGCVVEVGETAVLVMKTGPLASDDDEPVEIPLDTIDLGTLRYVESGVIVPFAST